MRRSLVLGAVAAALVGVLIYGATRPSANIQAPEPQTNLAGPSKSTERASMGASGTTSFPRAAQPKLSGVTRGSSEPQPPPMPGKMKSQGDRSVVGTAQWRMWADAFVSDPQVRKPPAAYRGSDIAWRLKEPHTLSATEVKMLTSHLSRLSNAERIALLGRLERTGGGAEADVLADRSEDFRRASDIVRTMHASALVAIMNRVYYSRVTPPRPMRLTPKPDVSDMGAVARTVVEADVRFIHERGATVEASAWSAIDRRIRHLRKKGFARLPEVQDAWRDLELALVDPVLGSREGRAPPNLDRRFAAAENMQSSHSAAALIRSLYSWDETRRWMLASKRSNAHHTTTVLRHLLHMVWKLDNNFIPLPQDEAVQRDLIRWLARVRTGDLLTEGERRVVRRFCRSVATTPRMLAPDVRKELARW